MVNSVNYVLYRYTMPTGMIRRLVVHQEMQQMFFDGIGGDKK